MHRKVAKNFVIGIATSAMFFALLLSVADFAAASPRKRTAIGAVRLPQLKIDPSSLTVSGVSSGGFMAVQLHVAHSAAISGVASVAGGIYWCAEGDRQKSSTQCMASPHSIKVKRYFDKAVAEAKASRIDRLENLRDDRVYLFSSPSDYIIRQAASDKLAEFYSKFMPESSIVYRSDTRTAHGFPTLDFGAMCNAGGLPWLLNCNIDLAGEILSSLYGKLRAGVTAEPENMHVFDQTEFGSETASMLNYGFVYVPTACAQGAVCRLHIALHGCQMNPEFINTDFAVRGGYNPWAESNNVVVLYPNSTKTNSNPYACWDWFGFTGSDYAVKSGVQMKAIKGMIDRLSPASARLTRRTR